jgi:ATP-dependent DNA helicase RecG
MPPTLATPAAKDKSGPQRALEKLGLVRPIDFALHLPMRYEDETRLVPIGSLRDGSVGQVEGGADPQPAHAGRAPARRA